MLSKYELLKERYMLVTPYPNCGMEKGDILIKEKWSERFHIVYNSYFYRESRNGRIFNHQDVEPYSPGIFTKLKWFEERRLEDLPDYVSINKIVWKIKKWEFILGQWLPFVEKNKRTSENFRLEWHSNNDLSSPATEEEYLEQQNNPTMFGILK